MILIYVVYTINGDVRDLRAQLIKELGILPTYTAQDTICVLDVREIREIKITVESNNKTPSIQSFANARIFGDSFRNFFLSWQNRPGISKEVKEALDVGIRSMDADFANIYSVMDTYNKIQSDYVAYAFDCKEDLINFLYK